MIRNHLVKEKDYQRKDQQLGKRKKKRMVVFQSPKGRNSGRKEETKSGLNFVLGSQMVTHPRVWKQGTGV